LIARFCSFAKASFLSQNPGSVSLDHKMSIALPQNAHHILTFFQLWTHLLPCGTAWRSRGGGSSTLDRRTRYRFQQWRLIDDFRWLKASKYNNDFSVVEHALLLDH